tara:strand:- start:856 stop:1224 length:369 start_codon:yes stop_codon:yes gene_type:complete
MKILEEKALPLLKRKSIIAEVEHFKKATPSKKTIISSLSKETKSPEDAISLLHLYTNFGSDRTKIIANIYKNKEDKDAIEKINKKAKKKKEGEEAPAQEQTKEAPKEETKDGKEASKEQKTE